MTDPVAPATRTARSRSLIAVVAVLVVVVSLSIAGLALRPSTASAANLTASQCNGIGPGAPGGATTAMHCTVTIVNTIDSTGRRSSTAAVSADCHNNPCAPASVPVSSNNLITNVDQCNSSDNDASQQILCTVSITNDIAAGTPGAEPVTSATVDQCVGSATTGTRTAAPSPRARPAPR